MKKASSKNVRVGGHSPTKKQSKLKVNKADAVTEVSTEIPSSKMLSVNSSKENSSNDTNI